MIEKKRVDIDNIDEFLSIELDKNISVGDIIDILDIECKKYVSCYTNRVKKFINKKEHKLKRIFLNTAKMLIDNKDKLDINIIDALFIYRLGYISEMIFKYITKRDNLKRHDSIMLARQMYIVYNKSYNKHKGLLKEDFIKHKELLFFINFTNKDINSLDTFDNSIYKEIAILSNVELEYNKIFQNIHNSLIGTNYNMSIDINQEDECDLTYSFQLKNKVTKKMSRLELFHKLHIVEKWAKDFVVIFFKIVDTYGKNSNFFKILENSSVVDKTNVERLKKDIDIVINRAIVYNHIVTDVTEYRED
mgnify:FL=1